MILTKIAITQLYWADIPENIHFLMKGLLITLKLSIISITGSMLFGTILGILRYSRIFLINWLVSGYIELVRSIPLILFIVFVHFGAMPYFLGKPSSFFMSSCVAFIAFTSAYIAEIIRSGLNSVEKGHIDAAKSLGFSSNQRLAYIILPLAVSRMIPAIVSQFISLIKDTSLASTLGLIEFTRASEIVYQRTFHELEILIFTASIYFVICFGLSKLSRIFEGKPHLFSKTIIWGIDAETQTQE